MRSSARYLAFAFSLSALVACGSSDSKSDSTGECGQPAELCAAAGAGGEGGSVSSGGTGGSGGSQSAGTGGTGGTDVGGSFVPTEDHEADIGEGWIAAGQPSEERLTEVVNLGARIITLRPAVEDPYDEQALVEGLGGTFIRYPTVGSDYDDVAFREAMYDLYDAEFAKGGNVYLHCASSNRVGASWALYNAERRGVPAEEALELGKAAGLSSLESRVREILGL